VKHAGQALVQDNGTTATLDIISQTKEMERAQIIRTLSTPILPVVLYWAIDCTTTFSGPTFSSFITSVTMLAPSLFSSLAA
jgi:hypothetical protein